jgi:hypothetical protein
VVFRETLGVALTLSYNIYADAVLLRRPVYFPKVSPTTRHINLLSTISKY